MDIFADMKKQGETQVRVYTGIYSMFHFFNTARLENNFTSGNGVYFLGPD